MLSKILDNDGLIIDIFISDKCNLECTYCSVNNNNSFSFDKIKIDKIVLLLQKNTKIQNVNILGGEPTLNENLIYFIEQLYEIEHILNIFLYTNLFHFKDFFTPNKKLNIVCTYHFEKDYKKQFKLNFEKIVRSGIEVTAQLIFQHNTTFPADIPFVVIPLIDNNNPLYFLKLKKFAMKNNFRVENFKKFSAKNLRCEMRNFEIKDNSLISSCEKIIYKENVKNIKELSTIYQNCKNCDYQYCNLFNKYKGSA